MLYNCSKSKEPCAVLARLWLMSQKVAPQELEPILGKKLLEFLGDWGLLVEHDGGLGGSVDIHPCLGRYFLTDRAIGLQRDLQSVYHLGGDSYALAWLAPRLPFQRGLDLATGSGVHAVLAAEHTAEVHAVDISQRALDFATFNATLNETRTITFHLGDIYEVLPETQFDFVLSNLPWVPTPDEPMELYRSGGLDGEVLIRRMVQGLPGRLQVGGWMASYIEYPKYAHDTYLERVKGWLGDGSWGIVLMNLRHFTNAGYIMPHVVSHSPPDLSSEFASWMASYEGAGIQGMGWAMLYVKRLEHGESWSVVVEADFPLTPQHWVGEWLQELARAHEEPPALHGVARLHQDLCLLHDPCNDTWRAEWPTRCLKPVELASDDGAQLFQLSKGEPLDAPRLSHLRKLGLFAGS